MTDPKLKLTPPFTREAAVAKIRAAEDGWNSRDPKRVSLAYSPETSWRNRSQFLRGRDAVVKFLENKWDTELEYRLIKEIWSHGADRIAVRFAYEYHNPEGQWFRAYGNENWEFDNEGLMKIRHASINDVPIEEGDRKFHWDRSAPRPSDHPSLSDLGL